MSILKRLVTTVHASVDRTVSQIENHDAIVEAALKDSRRAIAQARLRLGRVERDGKQEQTRIQDLETEIRLWTARTKMVAETDRDKAMECLLRRQQSQDLLDAAKLTLVEHRKLERQLQADVSELEQRVHGLQQQRNQMRSRESAAEARRVVNSLDGQCSNSIEDTLERWEISISENETLQSDVITPGRREDALSAEFLSMEKRDALSTELDDLLNSKQE